MQKTTKEDKEKLMNYLAAIKRRLKMIGLSQSEVGKRIGVGHNYVSKMLSGKINISFYAASRLARAAEMEFFPELRRPRNRPEVTAPAVYALHPEAAEMRR